MRRLVLLLFAAFTAATLAAADLIPRRITITLGDDVPGIVGHVLYSSLAQENPLVLSGAGGHVNNAIAVETDGSMYQYILTESDETIDSRMSPIPNALSLPETCRDIAKAWKGYLGLVQPIVVEEVVRETGRIAGEVDFEQTLLTPFQTTLWLPVALRLQMADVFTFSYLWPLAVDFFWFPGDSFGFSASLGYEYSNPSPFTLSAATSANGNADVHRISPSVGIVFRSIGRLSAEISVQVNLSIISITANEDLNLPLLASGESTAVFYPTLNLSPAISWNINSRWALKAKILEFELPLSIFKLQAGDTSIDIYPVMDMYILQLGVAYRW